MKINHNISAIKSYTKLSRTNNALQDSIERLSSGYRINKAADDAAGMAISQKMRSQIRGLEQASRNAADGVSVIETAEGALNEVEAMLQRMRELCVQATNETNTADDREQIQSEIDQLGAEIDRISTDTEFNTKKLLNGDADRQFYANKSGVKVKSVSDGVKAGDYKVTVEKAGTKAKTEGAAIGSGAAPVSGTVTINGETVEIKEGDSLSSIFESIQKLGENVDVEVTMKQDDNGNDIFAFTSKYEGAAKKIEISCEDKDGTEAKLRKFLGLGAPAVKGGTIDPDNAKIAPADGKVTISVDGVVKDVDISEDASLESILNSMQESGEEIGVDLTIGKDADNNDILIFSSKEEGKTVNIVCNNDDLKKFLGLNNVSNTLIDKKPVNGTDAKIACDAKAFDMDTTIVSADGNQVTILGKDGFEMKFDLTDPSSFDLSQYDFNQDGIVNIDDVFDDMQLDPNDEDDKKTAAEEFDKIAENAKIDITVLDAGPVTLQVGSNEGQTIVVGIPRVDTEILEIADINVRNTDGASEGIAALDSAINKVSTVRAKLGAYENRLDHCINNLDTSNENITEALTRVDDLDMAEEMTKYSQLNILQQAGTAMLSQANQMPQTILSMLQG